MIKNLVFETILLICLVFLRDAAYGYSMGAPDAACSDMLPGHQHRPQASPLQRAIVHYSVQDTILERTGVHSRKNSFLKKVCRHAVR